MLFTFRTLIVGARGRVGTHDQEIRARGETLMPGAGGKDGDVASLYLDRYAVVTAKANRAFASGDAKHLVNA
jgi:hypothetical protein